MRNAAVSAFGWKIEELVVLGIASGVLSLLITQSSLTRSWRHEWLHVPWFGELINCPFCMAFWTSLLLGEAVRTSKLHEGLIGWWAITGLAILFIGAAQKLLLIREAELESMRIVIKAARTTIEELK